jgi:hypothetical protein
LAQTLCTHKQDLTSNKRKYNSRKIKKEEEEPHTETKKHRQMLQTRAYSSGTKENHLKPQLHFSGNEGHLGSQCQVLLDTL